VSVAANLFCHAADRIFPYAIVASFFSEQFDIDGIAGGPVERAINCMMALEAEAIIKARAGGRN
jgi:hypothetical protein